LVVRFCSSKQVAQQNEQPNKVAVDDSANHIAGMGAMYSPTGFQRKVLVHFKFYPNIEAVPESVTHSQLNKAMSMMRIKVSIAMMFFGLLGCFITVLYGRNHRYETSMIEVNKRRHEAMQSGEEFIGGRRSLVVYDRESAGVSKE